MRKSVRSFITTTFILFVTMVWAAPVYAHFGPGADEIISYQMQDMIIAGSSLIFALFSVFVIWIAGNSGLNWRHYSIVGLLVATASIHLLEAMRGGIGILATAFYLNGAGYLVLGATLFLPFDFLSAVRGQTRWPLIGFTLITIIAFFVMHPWGLYRGQVEWLGMGTKLIEILLIILLIVERGRDPTSYTRRTAI